MQECGTLFNNLITHHAVKSYSNIKGSPVLIHCDELISLPKSMLTNYVGKLSPEKHHRLGKALKIALQLHEE